MAYGLPCWAGPCSSRREEVGIGRAESTGDGGYIDINGLAVGLGAAWAGPCSGLREEAGIGGAEFTEDAGCLGIDSGRTELIGGLAVGRGAAWAGPCSGPGRSLGGRVVNNQTYVKIF